MRITRHMAAAFVVALATFLSAAPSQAQTASWTSAGSMTTARSYHTATVLGNGKILIAGGFSQTGATSTAEIYNPTTNTWASTGGMTAARYLHTATLLKDGRVLVVGGANTSGGRLASAELYDPTTGTWTATGSMAVARSTHSAVYLQNGTVLVEGGCCDTVPNILTDLSSAELWDPSTGKWSGAGTLHAPHASGAAYMLSDGNVLVPGGTFMENGGSGSATDLYSAGIWSALPSLNQTRSAYAGDVLNNDFVVVTGGNAGGCCSGTATAELYDPATQAWQALPNMSTQRRDHAAVAIANGTQLLVSGGYTCCSDPAATRNSAEIFDLATRTWSTTASMYNPRYGHTLTRIFDGTVLVVGGGIYSSAPYMATAERYHPGGAAAVPVQIIIGSSPNGVGLAVSGVKCSPGGYATQATISWIPGESCTVAVTPLAGYLFDKWNDGNTANPRTFIAPATPTGYTFTLKAGAPTVAATEGTPQSTTVGTAFASRFGVIVRDASGAPTPNVIVTFTAPAGGGASGTFAGSNSNIQTALTNGSGMAGATVFTANSVTGNYTVVASIPASTSTASFLLTNTANTSVPNITATSGTPQTATIKTIFATALVATVKSSTGTPVSGVTVTFTAPASGASVTFAGNVNTAVTNASGVATSAAITANGSAGSYSVTATTPGASAAAVFALTNRPGAAASITASGGTPQSATVSKAFAAALSATVKDSGSNPVSGVVVTFAAPGSGASGTFSGGVLTATTNASGVATSPLFTANATAGAYTVTAAVAGVATKASFALTNTAASTGGKTLVPSSYITTLGSSGGQSVAALGVQDQSGSASSWNKYVEFNPKSGATYAGYQVFTLPAGTAASSLKTLQLNVNYHGPASNTTTWTWQIFNWTTGTWVTVGNNAGAPDWGAWKVFTFSIPGTLSNYVRNTDGQILVQLLSNNAKDSADIDYESLNFTN